MFIVTHLNEMINSQHVTKFKTNIYEKPASSTLIAHMTDYPYPIEIYKGSSQEVKDAFDNLIEAFTSNAVIIDYSQK